MLTTDFIPKVEKLGYSVNAKSQRFLEIHRDNRTDTSLISSVEVGYFKMTIDDIELARLFLEYSFTPLHERGAYDYKLNQKGK